MLEVADVHTYYGDSYVLQGVSLSVGRGEVVGLLGRNGMGKTTLIRTIVGFTPPRRGRVVFKEREITGWPSNRVIGLGLGLVPQGRRVFPSLTVAENLDVAVRGNAGPWSVKRAMELFPRLRERAENRAGKLSGGEQQMLAIARALMANPDLLLMDEPSDGLAPTVVDLIGEAIGGMKAEGVTLVVVEQDLHLAFAVAEEPETHHRDSLHARVSPAVTRRDSVT